MTVLEVADLVLSVLDISGSRKSILLASNTRRWFWKHVSKSWPAAQATVLSGHIQESPGGYCILSAPYSFYAGGDRYGGRYQCEFSDQWKAEEMLQHLLKSPQVVRYKPGNPEISVRYLG